MSEPKFDDTLSRYASRKTTPAEEKSLFRAAAEDQDAFDSLVREEMLRELMDDPVSRQILLKATEPEPAWRGVLRWLQQPRVMWPGVGAVAAAALAIVFFMDRQPGGSKVILNAHAPTSMDSLPAEVKKEFDTYARTRGSNDNAVSINSVTVGKGVRVLFDCRIEAKVMLIEEGPDGGGRILFPNRWAPDAKVAAGTQVAVPPASEDSIAMDGPGKHHLILAAFPANSDPTAAIQRGDKLPEPVWVDFRDFEVKP